MKDLILFIIGLIAADVDPATTQIIYGYASR